MRPIKFRGRVLDSDIADAGKMVFGYFVRGGNKKPYILVDNPNNNGQSLYQVDEDSVAQLVGYDKAGNEVYEGDEIVAKNGSKWVAVLNATVTLPEFANRSREPLKVNGFKLKEV